MIKKNHHLVPNEIEVLQLIKGKSLGFLEYQSHYISGDNCILVTEYLEGYQILTNYVSFFLRMDEAVQVGKTLIGHLEELHALNIVHRDIKPDNIMIEIGTLRCKYIDFGFACHQDKIGTLFTGGSIFYISLLRESPEIPRTFAFYQAADRWALASVIYYLLTQRNLFSYLVSCLYRDEKVNGGFVLRNLKNINYDCIFSAPRFIYFEERYPDLSKTLRTWLVIEQEDSKNQKYLSESLSE